MVRSQIVILVGAALLPLLSACARECRPIDEENQARAALIDVLTQRYKRSNPKSVGFRIVNIDKQITNINVDGPRMDFDPPNMRYVSFSFDTKCGRQVRATAMYTACGVLLNAPVWEGGADCGS